MRKRRDASPALPTPRPEDDLAYPPEALPVHDWQKQELARRKANLLGNPASGLSWEEVKRRVRARYAH
jgi:putative addiction module component (TIGR02574 family)